MPPSQRIEALETRIQTNDTITDADENALLKLHRELKLRQTEIGDYRREKLLRHNVIIAEKHGDIAAALEDRAVAEDIVAWIYDTFPHPETNKDYRVAFKQFGRYCTDEGVDGPDSPPASIDWVSSKLSNDYNTTPDPSEMYRWDDHIEPMLDACRNLRDAAVITLQWDVGLRSGELHAPDNDTYVTIGDIQESEWGYQVSVNGKQGRRSPTLIPSVPYVQRWLEAHPQSSDPSAPFVASMRDGSVVSKRAFIDIFKTVVDRADMTPPSSATPTRFRKSSVSYLASQNVSQAHLEQRYGWVRGSDAAARYIAVFSEATPRAVAEAHGLDVDPGESESLGPVECPRCTAMTPRQREYCIECGQALDQSAAKRVRDVSQVLDSAVVEAESAEQRSSIVNVRQSIESNPEVLSSDEVAHVLSSLEAE